MSVGALAHHAVPDVPDQFRPHLSLNAVALVSPLNVVDTFRFILRQCNLASQPQASVYT